MAGKSMHRPHLIVVATAGVLGSLAVATATAEGLRQVGIALSDRGGIEAMQLRIGEEYVKQFGKLAQSGTTLVVPANLTDLASIVTMATSIARKPPAGTPPPAGAPFAKS